MGYELNVNKIKEAAGALSRTTEGQRNKFLHTLSREVTRREKDILAANLRDVRKAQARSSPSAFIERLVLDRKGVDGLVKKLSAIARLKSGLGACIEKRTRKNLVLKKVRVPLGVLMVIYEARPEVTIDVTSLCVKSGNAAILKGGSQAAETNAVLCACIAAALKKAGLPIHAVSCIDPGNRSAVNSLLKRNDVIDLVIARGGYAMVKAVQQQSRIPVLAHASGGARIYVDKSADPAMTEKILVNAKITKPAACNSLDTILVHRSIAKTFVPRITKAMEAHRVTVKRAIDWDTETLGLVVGIKIVNNAEEAVAFIRRHTKGHSEGIIAKDTAVIEYFTKSVDAAAVFVNASTRLHDGFVFGMGSEMGISTSKLHARGPVGLAELTTYTWHAYGTGTIREV